MIDAPRIWSSYHLVFAGDRDRLLVTVVRPVVAELLRAGVIDRFFFVRYSLGGPHLRVRLRHDPAEAEPVSRRLRGRALELFEASPSTPWPEERIRRVNREIQSTDDQAENRVEPNDSVRKAEFEPETARYGGPARLDASLRYFHVSSLEILRLLKRHRGAPSARRLALGLVTMVQQALGFAADADELLEILGWPLAYWRREHSVLVDRGDAVFAKRRGAYRRLLEHEIERVLASAESSSQEPEGNGFPGLVIAARRLDSDIRPVDPPTRRRVIISQMHMTANRLGLRPPEECYLSRILTRAAGELARAEPSTWTQLDAALRRGARVFSVSFEELFRRALDAAAPT